MRVMRVKVELHAVLRELLPGGKGEVEVQTASTVTDLLDQLKVDPELRELVTINGDQIHDLATQLREGDTVAVFPAVAGGRRSPYLDEGIRLFNEGNYFLAHETLEEHWIEAEESERDFYQGLIHVAVGFHHYERGNTNGARSQFQKAFRRLSRYPENHDGVDVGSLRSFLEKAPDQIQANEELQPPRLD
jgi:molybdopterin converting factor small subunit